MAIGGVRQLRRQLDKLAHVGDRPCQARPVRRPGGLERDLGRGVLFCAPDQFYGCGEVVLLCSDVGEVQVQRPVLRFEGEGIFERCRDLDRVKPRLKSLSHGVSVEVMSVVHGAHRGLGQGVGPDRAEEPVIAEPRRVSPRDAGLETGQ
jgi:hypothetical protein